MRVESSWTRPMQCTVQQDESALGRTGGGVGDVGRDMIEGDRFCCRKRSRPGGNTRRSSASAGR